MEKERQQEEKGEQKGQRAVISRAESLDTSTRFKSRQRMSPRTDVGVQTFTKHQSTTFHNHLWRKRLRFVYTLETSIVEAIFPCI